MGPRILYPGLRLHILGSFNKKMTLPTHLLELWECVPAMKKAYLVGGCVRDELLGIEVTDYDIEVYGIGFKSLQKQLSLFGRTDIIGKSFGTIKLRLKGGEALDFSLPRKDSKSGPGHRGFDIEVDPELSPMEACSRRDYTINAMLMNPVSGEIIDPYGGRRDLANKVLRHVGPAFIDDPLRVLRGMQFAGRFELKAAEETIQLCQTIKDSYFELPKERIWGEWQKWASQSKKPSYGLRFLEETGWWDAYPIFKEMSDTPQDPIWHPEGDVWTHTLHVCDAMAQLEEWNSNTVELKIIYMMAALAHDFGKPSTTEFVEKDGKMRITSAGHAEAGVGLAGEFLNFVGSPNAILEKVEPLVAEHLNGRDATSLKAVRKLALRLSPATITDLVAVMKADIAGRPPLDPTPPESLNQLLENANNSGIEKSAPKSILLGRHLIERGYQPGPEMGAILKKAFEAQLDGEFYDLASGLTWLDGFLNRNSIG